MVALNTDNDKEKKDTSPAKEGASADGVVGGLKSKSLKAAGVGFLLADSALITSGIMAGEKGVGLAGVFGLTAGAVGTRYGNPKAEKQLEQVERRLGAYLRKQGVEIPKDPTTESLTKEGGVIDHIESFLYQYPSQVMNAFYSMIGVSFASQAVSQARRGGLNWENGSLLTSGALLIAGALSGILINEKKPDPDHPPQGMFQKAVSWVQEKPLRLTGTLFNANQVFLGMNALAQRRNNPDSHAYIPKMLAVACFTFGNTMMGMSSKSHGGGSNKMDDETKGKLAEASAMVIAAQPKEVQDGLLEHVAGYLATEPNVNMNAKEISEMLHRKLAEVKSKLPAANGWQGRIADAKGAQPQPSL